MYTVSSKVARSTTRPIEKSRRLSQNLRKKGIVDRELMSEMKVVLLTTPAIKKVARPDSGETTVKDKRLSPDDARLLIRLFCDYEAWMRDHKALFESQHGKVEASFASTIADPEWLMLADGRRITIYDRTDEDIDTDNVRTYDVFFDQGGFRIKHFPLKEEIEVWSNYEPHDLPRWLYGTGPLPIFSND